MKYLKYLIQTGCGVLLCVGIMFYRGIAEAGDTAERIMIVSDGFSVTALLFLSVGVLLWVATTGFFDIFGYAVKKGAHALLPGLVQCDVTGFYEYKQEKQADRKSGGEKSMLLVGLGFLLVSVLFTVVWYQC